MSSSIPVPLPSGNTALPYSPPDLLSLPLRALHHAEAFAFSTVPRQVGRILGIDDFTLNIWGGAVPSASETALTSDAMAAASQAAASMAGEGVPQAVVQGDSWYMTEIMQTMRKIGGFFGYITSIWSFACLAEVSASCS